VGQWKVDGRLRALLGIALVSLACIPGQASAALRTGISEQNPGMFGSPAFEALGISNVRVVVPWDAALVDDERAHVWIEAALARGSAVLVAFDKSRGVQCPGTTCAGPSIPDYEAGVAAFRARWPQITDITPWNEPNHKSQPTYSDPGLAGQYYNAARRVCPGCRLVAGDFLDDANLSSWLSNYRAVLTEQPAVWGLHNYWDATYFGDQGVETMLRGAPGELWLSETGGIVRFGTLAYDEARAADSIRWLYSMTRRRPRVTRMYLYHWQGSAQHDFDGGLIGPDGSERLGLAVVREELARKPDPETTVPAGQDGGDGATGSGGGGTGSGGGGGGGEAGPAGQGTRGSKAIRVRLSGKALRLLRRGLRVEIACVSAPSRCTGRVVVKLPAKAARSSAVRLPMNFDLRPGQSLGRFLRVDARTRALIERRRRLQVTYCVKGAAACRTQYRAVVRK
jgi:hypothetical protein